MKKIISCILFLIIVIATFSQQTEPTGLIAKQDYLKKSKNQKTAAWIMLGGGATLILTDIIIPRGELTREAFWNSYKNDGIKTSLGVTGFLSMLASVPFFISSGKNKKRAMKLSLINEKVMQIQKNGFVYQAIPSLSIKIGL